MNNFGSKNNKNFIYDSSNDSTELFYLDNNKLKINAYGAQKLVNDINNKRTNKIISKKKSKKHKYIKTKLPSNSGVIKAKQFSNSGVIKPKSYNQYSTNSNLNATNINLQYGSYHNFNNNINSQNNINFDNRAYQDVNDFFSEQQKSFEIPNMKKPKKHKNSNQKNSNHKTLRVFNIVWRILLFVILILFITLDFMTQSTIRINKTLPTINEYSVAIISSNDMEPALNINDMIILKNVDEYNNDDIVAYHDRSNICIVRRFVKINSLGNIITKADINILEDAPVSKDSMYGHVVYKIKGFGIIFNTYIKYVILLINIILIIVSFIVGKKLKTTKSKTKSKL